MPLSGLRVLIVDDDEDTCKIFSMVLEEANAVVVAALSMQGALQKLRTFHAHILLVDLVMPESSGFDLIRAVREMGLMMPAAAISASVGARDIEESQAVGFTLFLAKPVDIDEIVEAALQLASLTLESRAH